MKKIYKNMFKKDVKYLLILLSLLLSLYACKEQERFAIAYYDSEPPSPPVYSGKYVPLYGGARIFFEHPADRDLLSIDASYTNTRNEKVWFSVSYYRDSIDVYGLNDTLEHVIQLYAVDRAGNSSAIVPVPIVPLKPAVMQLLDSLTVKPGFGSFFIDWKNELKQNMNVYAHFNYTQKGEYKEHTLIYTSNLPEERWFIRDLDLTAEEPISLKIQVEDTYGNITDYIDIGQFALLEDEMIPKDKWTMPENNEYVHDSVGGVPMGYLSAYEARPQYAIDGIIDVDPMFHYIHTGSKGRTGQSIHGNVPWNIMINLGEEYELSRVVTHQRHSRDGGIRGQYYREENVGIYAMYIWDDVEEKWDSIREHQILFPAVSDIELKQLGLAGDMAYFYPDDPQFTKPTRWFRYEALKSFASNYTSTNCNCLSEITLYAKKKK
jgi:uncharacterized membrane protein YecN with MAPEG domain